MYEIRLEFDFRDAFKARLQINDQRRLINMWEEKNDLASIYIHNEQIVCILKILNGYHMVECH